MADTVSNLKVRFSADTKNFKKDMESGKAAMKGFSSQAGSAFDQFAQVFGVNMSQVTRSMNAAKAQAAAMSAGFKGAAVGSNFLSGALKILKLALISTGVGAIVVALGSLVTLFSRSTVWSDKLAAKMAGFKAIVAVVADRFALLGEALIKLIKFDLSGAAETAKKAFSGITEEIKTEASLAQKLKEEIIDLERRSKLFDAEKEAALTEIQRLRAIAKDKLANDQERLKAIQKAGDLEQKIADKSLALAEEELAASLDSYDAKSKKLKLDEKGLALIERIRKGEIGSIEAQELAKELTLDDANAKETLFNIIDKIIAREKEQQQIIQTRIRIQNAENTVRAEIANKNIAALKSQAGLLEKRAENERLAYDERIKLVRQAAAIEQEALKVALEANKIDRNQFLAETETLILELEEKLKKLGGSTSEIEPITISANLDTNLETDKLKKYADDNAETAQEVKSVWVDATEAINSSFQSLASGFGESLGNMIAGAEGFEGIEQLVLGTLANLAIQVGQIAIGAGLAVSGIKAALTSLNPGIAIAAGIALVALGTAVKASLSQAAKGAGSSTFSGSPGVYDSRSSFGTSTGTAAVQQEPITIHLTGNLKGDGKSLKATIDKQIEINRILG